MAHFASFHFSLLRIAAVVVILVPALMAADNGMDMSMDGAMSLTIGSMRPYLHFTGGDTIWFLGWVPESKGSIGGACVGLFLLALVDRWLAAIRATAEKEWRLRGQVIMANRVNAVNAGKKDGVHVRPGLGGMLRMRVIPPFIAAHDIVRGVLHMGQAALGFAFMLAVMTYNAGFIIAIVVGLGVGEMMFGRYIGAANHVH